MEPRLSSVGGQPVAVGLTWEIGEHPHLTKTLRFGAAGQGFACYSGSIAEAQNADLIGNIPLAALVGMLLADEREVIAAVMPLDDGGFWSAQFKDGSVLIDSEELFDDIQSALEWAAQAKRSNAVAQIYLPDGFVKTAHVTDTGLDPQVLPSLSSLSQERLDNAPVFVAYRVLTPMAALKAGAVVVGFTLGGLSLNALVDALSAQSDVPRVTETVVLEQFAVDGSSFAAACVAALGEEWPGVPGWEIASVGCALPNSVRPIGDPETAVVWKEFQRGERYAAILDSEVTSARMAEFMLRDWPHLKEIEEGRIVVGHGLETDWVPFVAPGEMVSFGTQIENAFISVLEDSTQPQVISSGQGQVVTPTVNTHQVTLNTSLEAAFTLAQALDGIEINTITFEDNVSTVLLSPTAVRFSRPANAALTPKPTTPSQSKR